MPERPLPSRSTRSRGTLAALALLAAAGGLASTRCGGEPQAPRPGGPGGRAAPGGSSGGTVAGSGMAAPTTIWNPYPDLGPPAIRLRHAGPASGITTVNHSGTEGVKEFLIEAVGVGAAVLDYDGDGFMDLYVPDGDVFSNYTLERVMDPVSKEQRPVLRRKEAPGRRFHDQLWRNNGDGTFTDVAAAAGVADERWSFGATALDYDGDGWTDLFVANFGLNRLWRNNGNGTFTDVAPELGVAGRETTWSTCCAAADLDGDERLDLYVPAYSDPAAEVDKRRVEQGKPLDSPVESISGRACRWNRVQAYCGPIGLRAQEDAFYRQTAERTFEDRSVEYGFRARNGPMYGFTALAWDVNEDGLMDVYVANDSVESFLWIAQRRAEGGLAFSELADQLGVKFGSNLSAQAGMGAAVADLNRDGLFDLFKTNFALDYNNMYMAQRTRPVDGRLYFKDRGLQVLGQAVYYDLSWGCGWYDLDNDRDLDLYVANGHVYKEVDLEQYTGSSYDQLNALIECVEPATLGYREIGRKALDRLGPAGAHLAAGDGMDVKQCSRGVAFADLNNDGRVDLFVTNMNEPPNLLLNETPPSPERQWALLSVRQPGFNRDALGAVVEVTAGGVTQRLPVIRCTSFLGSDDPRVHVGLGSATTFDVRVIWPGAARAATTYTGLAAGRHWLLHRAEAAAAEQPLKTFAWPAPN